MKVSVVPESSERCTGEMARSGSSTSGLSAAMASSFQLVISPAKTLAMVSADMFRLSTPSRLKATATGEMYIGSSTMPASPSAAQAAKPPAAISSSLNARSEPMKLLAPAMKFSRPVPDPVGS